MQGIVESKTEAKKVKSGTKADGTPYNFWLANLKINGVEYTVPGFSQPGVDEVLKGVTVGSSILFDLDKSSKYDNTILPGSISVLEEAKAEKVEKLKKAWDKNLKEHKEVPTVDWDVKDRRIVRQNCLAHADKWLELTKVAGIDTEAMEKEYFSFAKKCEDWVYRNE